MPHNLTVRMSTIPTVAIDETMLEPVVTNLISHIAVVLPIGVTIYGILVGIQMVPKILGMFIRA